MIYMVARQYKNGELRFMHSGRGTKTPFATENFSSAKAMATHAQRSAWKDVSEIVILSAISKLWISWRLMFARSNTLLPSHGNYGEKPMELKPCQPCRLCGMLPFFETDFDGINYDRLGSSVVLEEGLFTTLYACKDKENRLALYGSGEDWTELYYPRFCPECGRELS